MIEDAEGNPSRPEIRLLVTSKIKSSLDDNQPFQNYSTERSAGTTDKENVVSGRPATIRQIVPLNLIVKPSTPPSIAVVGKVPLGHNYSLINTPQPNVLRTPTKQNNYLDDPVTPTANLKLLTELASREPKYQRKQLVMDFEDGDSQGPIDDAAKPTTGRKEKSLGRLCDKFIEKYPEYPIAGDEMTIGLGEASKELGVERRRIYDIINVLESVHIVSRVAKNSYLWHGKTNLKTTLAKLKYLAESEKLVEQILAAKNKTARQDVLQFSENSSGENSQTSIMSEECSQSTDENGNNHRREKSLGIMSQRFLMLFLAVEPHIISLDIAAQILIGETSVEDKKSTLFKTKIRRLYDIANILSSLKLIHKVHVVESKGRKPAFQYVGPDIKNVPFDVSTMANALNDALGTQGKKYDIWRLSSMAQSGGIKRHLSDSSLPARLSKFPRTLMEEFNGQSGHTTAGTKTWKRHSSLQEVCRTTQEEQLKLLQFSKIAPRIAVTKTPVTDATKMSQVIKGQVIKPAVFLNLNGVSVKFPTLSPSQVAALTVTNRATAASSPGSSTSQGNAVSLVMASKKSQETSYLKVPLIFQLKRSSPCPLNASTDNSPVSSQSSSGDLATIAAEPDRLQFLTDQHWFQGDRQQL